MKDISLPQDEPTDFDANASSCSNDVDFRGFSLNECNESINILSAYGNGSDINQASNRHGNQNHESADMQTASMLLVVSRFQM